VVNRLTQVHQEHDVKTVAAASAAFVCLAYVNLDYRSHCGDSDLFLYDAARPRDVRFSKTC